jgi:hypothetical protein
MPGHGGIVMKYVAALAIAVFLGRFAWMPAEQASSQARPVAPVAAPRSDTNVARDESPMEIAGPEGSHRSEIATKVELAGELSSTAKRDPVASGSLHGHVIDPSALDRANLEGCVSVRFEAPSSEAHEDVRDVWSLRLPRSGMIQPNGEFEVQSLGLGTWTAICKLPSRTPIEAKITIERDGQRVRHDFTLDAQRHLLVSLHDAGGRPLLSNLRQDDVELAELLAPFVSSAEPSIGAGVSARGGAMSCRSHRLDKGRSDPWCEIDAEWSDDPWVGVVLGDHVLAYRRATSGVDEVSLVLPASALRSALGSMRVRVVDEFDSRPLQPVLISLTNQPEPKRGHSSRSFEVDFDGSTRFDSLLPGDVAFDTRLEGYVSSDHVVRVTAGTCMEVEIRMKRAITISGLVTDESGHPTTRILRALPAVGDRSTGSGTADAQPAADGSFVFRGLERGDYVLMDARRRAANSSDGRQFTKWSIPKGMLYVDARAGSVDGVSLVITGRDDPVGGVEIRR